MSTRWTWHGGGLEAAKRTFGGIDWLDLSTGINPHPWPGVDALTIDWRRLPEPEALAALETAAAAYFGTCSEHVCAVPGSEIGLRLVGRIVGNEARYVTPSYRTHGEMVADSRAIDREDLDATDATLILANPNNPDGRVIAAERLDALLRARRPGTWLWIDEAFADANPSASFAHRIDEEVPLAIFRSFGKFFGLAGVRLGFVLGPARLIRSLRALLGAWPLSAPAIAIGTAAYRDIAWANATRSRLGEDAGALDAVLERSGYKAIGNCPLFRLIEAADARALFDRLARRAILTRPFAEHPHWLRIGLPAGAEARERLEQALADG